MTAPAPSAPTDRDRPLVGTLRRQDRLLRQEMRVRLAGAAFAYALCTLYLDARLVLALALTDLAAEVQMARLLADPERAARDGARRRTLLALVFVAEACFALPPALIFHLDAPLVKALAVGILAGQMLNIVAVRSIWLPSGLVAVVTVGVLIFAGNAWFWLEQGSLPGLALTSAIAAVWVGYCFSALLSTNRLHEDAARAARAAREADAAKGRFLAQVSHELRTPLNAMLGLALAERDRAGDPEAQDRLSAMVGAAEGLRRLLDDILDLTAIEQGRLPIRPARADPAAEIAAVAALWRPAIEREGLRFSVAIAPDLAGAALIDRERLAQCLSNLLSNALRHAGAGTIALEARARPTATAGRQLVVEVADDGPGVPEALRGTLFQPLSAPEAGSGAPEAVSFGHGIGLSIARALARRMGGDLVLVEEIGGGAGGARFRLTVPLPAAPPLDGTAAGTPGRDVAPPVRLDGRRVLVVDDVAANRMVAAACLRALGAEAEEVASGAAALEAVGRKDWDAVLLDINMPGMDGLETFRRLRALPGASGRVPVLAVTADASPGHRSQFLAAGIDGYLAKPLTPEQLGAALAQVLAARRPA